MTMRAEASGLTLAAATHAHAATAGERHIVVLQLSAVLMAVWGTDHPGLQGVLMALCAVLLSSRRLLTSPWPWLLGAGVLGAWISVNSWSIVSQHKIFVFEWVLACGVTLFAPDPERALAVSGRFLLAGLFGLATFWKLAGGEYFDGGFMEWLLLWREELGGILSRFGGLDAALVKANYDAVAQLRSAPITNDWVAIHATPRIDLWGDLLSWGTILGEGVVALLFLAPLSERLRPARDLSILGFVLTVDVAFPYTGFAFPMLMAGLAQAPQRAWVRPVYLGTLVVHTLLVFLIHGHPLGRSILY
jgi:hypothetical protein